MKIALNDLLDYDNIVIQCHDFPDADTLASGYALYWFLNGKNKNVRLIYSGTREITKPNLLLMLSFFNIPVEYVKSGELGFVPELLVTVDCVDGQKNVTHFDAVAHMAIDHHESVMDDNENNDIRPGYGSCSTIMSVLLREAGCDYNDDIKVASALYYGLFTDTSGLSEIVNPNDKDLRDEAKFNQSNMMCLINSNISKEEMTIVSKTLLDIDYGEENSQQYAVASAEQCDPNVLGFINDLILQVQDVKISVVWCYVANGVKISVRSCTNEIKANELAKEICRDFDPKAGGGHSKKAGGFINSRIYEEIGPGNISAYIEKKIKKHCSEYSIIHSMDYSFDKEEFSEYEKKFVKKGYIPSCELFENGTAFIVRSTAEGGDKEVIASENVYIMIDDEGAYPIKKEKFENSYTVIDEKYVYDLKCDYIPKAICKSTMEGRKITEPVSCVSKPAKVYAKEIKNKIKLFTPWDENNYETGESGDFLVCSTENTKDMYIIEKDKFKQLYKKVN